MFSELDSTARGTFMGHLEAVLGLGWGIGAFSGGFLVNSDEYGLGEGPVIFSFMLTAFLGLVAVIGYMSSTEKKRDFVAENEDFMVYFRRLYRLFMITFILFMGYMFFLYLGLVLKKLLGPKKEWSTNMSLDPEGSPLALFQKRLQR